MMWGKKDIFDKMHLPGKDITNDMYLFFGNSHFSEA